MIDLHVREEMAAGFYVQRNPARVCLTTCHERVRQKQYPERCPQVIVVERAGRP